MIKIFDRPFFHNLVEKPDPAPSSTVLVVENGVTKRDTILLTERIVLSADSVGGALF